MANDQLEKERRLKQIERGQLKRENGLVHWGRVRPGRYALIVERDR